jgi:hypothetical protein
MDETDLKQPKIHRKIPTSLWIFKNLKKKNLETKTLGTVAKSFALKYALKI